MSNEIKEIIERIKNTEFYRRLDKPRFHKSLFAFIVCIIILIVSAYSEEHPYLVFLSVFGILISFIILFDAIYKAIPDENTEEQENEKETKEGIKLLEDKERKDPLWKKVALIALYVIYMSFIIVPIVGLIVTLFTDSEEFILILIASGVVILIMMVIIIPVTIYKTYKGANMPSAGEVYQPQKDEIDLEDKQNEQK